MTPNQCSAMAQSYRVRATRIQKELIEKWPGAFEQLCIWQSDKRMLEAHADAYEAAARIR